MGSGPLEGSSWRSGSKGRLGQIAKGLKDHTEEFQLHSSMKKGQQSFWNRCHNSHPTLFFHSFIYLFKNIHFVSNILNTGESELKQTKNHTAIVWSDETYTFERVIAANYKIITHDTGDQLEVGERSRGENGSKTSSLHCGWIPVLLSIIETKRRRKKPLYGWFIFGQKELEVLKDTGQ